MTGGGSFLLKTVILNEVKDLYKFLSEFAICLAARYIPLECDILAIARAICPCGTRRLWRLPPHPGCFATHLLLSSSQTALCSISAFAEISTRSVAPPLRKNYKFFRLLPLSAAYTSSGLLRNPPSPQGEGFSWWCGISTFYTLISTFYKFRRLRRHLNY